MLMKNELSVEKKAQTIVETTMGDITRATRKVLMDYVSKMYVVSFAKVIAYLGQESEESLDLLNNMDADTRRQIEAFAKGYQKSEPQVVSEVEHIVTANGMNLDDDYKKLKENLILSGQQFTEKAIRNFRSETPIFQKKLNNCIFAFEDIINLDDRAIQKTLRDVDQQELAKALRGASPEIQDKFFRNLPVRYATMLKEDMEFMGPVIITDVKKAQARIVQIILQLEAKGEIVIVAKHEISKLLF